MPGEDYFGNFQKAVDALAESRMRIFTAETHTALSQAERDAQVAMHNLYMYFGRLSFWLSEASDAARRQLNGGALATNVVAAEPVAKKALAKKRRGPSSSRKRAKKES